MKAHYLIETLNYNKRRIMTNEIQLCLGHIIYIHNLTMLIYVIIYIVSSLSLKLEGRKLVLPPFHLTIMRSIIFGFDHKLLLNYNSKYNLRVVFLSKSKIIGRSKSNVFFITEGVIHNLKISRTNALKSHYCFPYVHQFGPSSWRKSISTHTCDVVMDPSPKLRF